jgi:hypothetical protein
MPRHCPFPVRSTDNRRGYRAGTVPGFTLSLALIAALSGYASLTDAAPAAPGNKSNAAMANCPFLPAVWSAGPRAGCWSRRAPVCPSSSSSVH